MGQFFSSFDFSPSKIARIRPRILTFFPRKSREIGWFFHEFAPENPAKFCFFSAKYQKPCREVRGTGLSLLYPMQTMPWGSQIPQTQIKELRSPKTSNYFKHCQARGHNINPHNAEVFTDRNHTIKYHIKEAGHCHHFVLVKFKRFKQNIQFCF